jgi:hypothetical protein
MLNVQSVYKRMYNQENRGIRIYRVSLNYRIPSSGLSRRHPVYQVKMFKKKLLTLRKISKLPIFVQKYLINILAMLYFPFEQKLEK